MRRAVFRLTCSCNVLASMLPPSARPCPPVQPRRPARGSCWRRANFCPLHLRGTHRLRPPHGGDTGSPTVAVPPYRAPLPPQHALAQAPPLSSRTAQWLTGPTRTPAPRSHFPRLRRLRAPGPARFRTKTCRYLAVVMRPSVATVGHKEAAHLTACDRAAHQRLTRGH